MSRATTLLPLAALALFTFGCASMRTQTTDQQPANSVGTPPPTAPQPTAPFPNGPSTIDLNSTVHSSPIQL